MWCLAGEVTRVRFQVSTRAGHASPYRLQWWPERYSSSCLEPFEEEQPQEARRWRHPRDRERIPSRGSQTFRATRVRSQRRHGENQPGPQVATLRGPFDRQQKFAPGPGSTACKASTSRLLSESSRSVLVRAGPRPGRSATGENRPRLSFRLKPMKNTSNQRLLPGTGNGRQSLGGDRQ